MTDGSKATDQLIAESGIYDAMIDSGCSSCAKISTIDFSSDPDRSATILRRAIIHIFTFRHFRKSWTDSGI